MTDNEIIKALPTVTYGGHGCMKCNYGKEGCGVKGCEIARNALDLINRQKAEIERLKKNIDGLNIFTTNHMKVIRLQAIKEFADRLRNCFCVSKEYLDIVNIIDNLVKEMTEENEK